MVKDIAFTAYLLKTWRRCATFTPRISALSLPLPIPKTAS